MYSDVSRFSFQSDSFRNIIWRAPGTRYHQENTIERHRYGGAGWLVWGGNILGSRTDLRVQSVTMTGHIYRDVILEQHVRLFRGAMGAEFLFMDDNTRPHRANIVDECLQSEDITRMDWPTYSPDLNPIEHVWDMLGRRIAARQPPPTCLPELRRTLLDERCNIPKDQIDNLILSMPRRSDGHGKPNDWISPVSRKPRVKFKVKKRNHPISKTVEKKSALNRLERTVVFASSFTSHGDEEMLLPDRRYHTLNSDKIPECEIFAPNAGQEPRVMDGNVKSHRLKKFL
ncbi:transposable element Tcb1 transposase [Trichonephila clavipes]|nr:transposable element Tcb1 transposase [Trichonephila clavipes]